MNKEFLEKYKEEIKQSFKDLKKKETRVKQIPNLLTASRLLAPFFIVPAAFSGNLPLAILFTVVFSLTDAFDGYAARKLNAVSEFGKDLDPIVDKLFTAGLAIPLIITNPVIIVNILSELMITKINTDSKLKGNIPRTTVLGKVKTAALSVSLLLAYIGVSSSLISSNAVNIILLATSGIQFLTAHQYKDIDKKKDELKENKIIEVKNNEETEETVMEKVKRYSRENEISALKELKNELINGTKKEEEKSKTKTLKK
ncbi:MAG: CDP-alcohol phosphatidyltransferase family protein [Bacilli bacterium]